MEIIVIWYCKLVMDGLIKYSCRTFVGEEPLYVNNGMNKIAKQQWIMQSTKNIPMAQSVPEEKLINSIKAQFNFKNYHIFLPILYFKTPKYTK